GDVMSELTHIWLRCIKQEDGYAPRDLPVWKVALERAYRQFKSNGKPGDNTSRKLARYMQRIERAMKEE
ncbi:MAG: hypothetical protein RR482_04430, partial [Clostridia bacterium]